MEGLKEAVKQGGLYDYIASHYYELDSYQLKEILLSVLGVGLDKCYSKEDEEAYAELIFNEMEDRGLFD